LSSCRDAASPTPGKLWGARDAGLELLKVGTKRVTTGPVTEHITSDVHLIVSPAITCWPEDGGPFITLCRSSTRRILIAADPTSACIACRYDARTSRHALADRQGRRIHYAVADARGESLPATVFLGGPLR
jgi:UbiD family decarboxylase